MNLSEILTISGKPGLYKIIAQNPGRVIVESIEDGKRSPVFIRDNFSILSDISLFTEEDDIPLSDVFKALYELEGGKVTIDHKAADEELAAKLLEVVPNYDKEGVRHSDMRKLFKWFNLIMVKKLWTPADLEEKGAAKAKSEEEE